MEFLFDIPDRLTSWPEDITIDGKVFRSTGSLIDIALPAVDLDVVARECTLTLSQLNQASILRIFNTDYSGIDINIYLTTKREPYKEDTRLLFVGVWDHHTLSPSDDGYTLSIRVTSQLNTLRNTDPERYTDAQHQLRYPGDKFFEFINAQVDRRLD